MNYIAWAECEPGTEAKARASGACSQVLTAVKFVTPRFGKWKYSGMWECCSRGCRGDVQGECGLAEWVAGWKQLRACSLETRLATRIDCCAVSHERKN